MLRSLPEENPENLLGSVTEIEIKPESIPKTLPTKNSLSETTGYAVRAHPGPELSSKMLFQRPTTLLTVRRLHLSHKMMPPQSICETTLKVITEDLFGTDPPDELRIEEVDTGASTAASGTNAIPSTNTTNTIVGTGKYFITAASLKVLVEVITGGRFILYDFVPKDQARALLLTYRLYASPSSLAKELQNRYEQTRNPAVFTGTSDS